MGLCKQISAKTKYIRRSAETRETVDSEEGVRGSVGLPDDALQLSADSCAEFRGFKSSCRVQRNSHTPVAATHCTHFYCQQPVRIRIRKSDQGVRIMLLEKERLVVCEKNPGIVCSKSHKS